MTAENYIAVASIEKKCFGPECWSEKLIFDELSDPNKYYIVYYSGGAAAGFGGYAQVLDEGHIMNIAVAEEYRNRGIATEILHNIIENGKTKGINSFTLEVRVSNRIARLLYEKAGFGLVGIRKGYYPDREDACIYWLYM
jgi:ribosomal-protein-alanine N-acetyltransferase